ncbi:MAG: hypothetical protein CMG50_00145 [Candidatus Marinimicrobia bacterium]|nr:hypothetical protein [Candidatus Neomarinimicrobiota bacterium]MBV19627.1 hypothetical protein [Cytophagia bacterium]|tara:strand:+ start:202 stop:690 length:489 start_codon:yes stop_codon:yes gene_type:complete
MSNFKLKNFDSTAKTFLAFFLFTIQIGIVIGVGYIYYTTSLNPEGTIEHYNGSEVVEDVIPEEFPKPLEGMILTTHAHVNSFALISLIIGSIFYFNSIITNKLKLILMVEPFISTIITFSSIWVMRYLNESFVYLVMISSLLMYLCWTIMVIISFYELLFEK